MHTCLVHTRDKFCEYFLLNLCYFFLLFFILIYLCILSLFAFNVLLILRLLLVFICIESLVAHAPLFAN